MNSKVEKYGLQAVERPRIKATRKLDLSGPEGQQIVKSETIMSPSTLPSQATVIVIGGGIMGCSTLYHLARMGVSDAILLERNKLTSGTTWHSAAQVRALPSRRRPPEPQPR